MVRTPRNLSFEGCFPAHKVVELCALLPATYAALNSMVPRDRKRLRWPTQVRCMSHEQIISGRERGAGHGFTYIRGEDRDTIWLNHHMTDEGYWLVFVHENLHHAFPDATEDELNNRLVPEVYQRVFGRTMPRAWARRHGLGPPEPGIGDRGYVY